MTCPVCTTRVYLNSDYCPECGNQVRGRGQNFYVPLPLPVESEPQRELFMEDFQ